MFYRSSDEQYPDLKSLQCVHAELGPIICENFLNLGMRHHQGATFLAHVVSLRCSESAKNVCQLALPDYPDEMT